MGRHTIHVVGESFRNRDGSDRQSEIRLCKVGEPVRLEREPENPHDPNCIKVISVRGVQIGNIGRDNAEWIAERLHRGGSVAAEIDQIGTGESGLLGVVLTVTTAQEDPAAATVAEALAPPPAPSKSGCAKLVLIGLGILLVLAVIAAIVGPPPPSQPTRPDPKAATPVADSPAETSTRRSLSLSRITADEFNRIEEGMTYGEVVAIVGEPGEEVSSSNIAGYSTKMYSWQNYDGSNANVMIQNGRVVMKAQFGL